MFRFLVSSLPFHPSWVTDGEKSAISMAKSLTSYISSKGRFCSRQALVRHHRHVSQSLKTALLTELVYITPMQRFASWKTLLYPNQSFKLEWHMIPVQAPKHPLVYQRFFEAVTQDYGEQDPKRSFCSRILSGCLSWVTEARGCVK